MWTVMRNVPAYTWETILKEKVPRTMISKELIDKERAAEAQSMNRAKRGKR